MNVFADMDLPGTESRMGKAELGIRVARAVRARGLTQVDAARVMGVSLNAAGQLLRGQPAAFSSEQLRRILAIVAPF